MKRIEKLSIKVYIVKLYFRKITFFLRFFSFFPASCRVLRSRTASARGLFDPSDGLEKCGITGMDRNPPPASSEKKTGQVRLNP